MRSWLFKSIIIIGVFAGAWLFAMFHWQTSHRVPNGADIGLYFIALPLGILLAIWLSIKSWKAFKNRKNDVAAEDKSAAPAAATQSGDEQERFLSAAILSAAVYTQYGQSTDELLSAATSNAIEISLDPILVNESGYPILSSRIMDLDEDAEHEALTMWTEEAKLPAVSWSSDQVRAIASSNEVLKQLLQEAMNHPSLEPYLAAKSSKQKTEEKLPVLTLSLLHPAHWDEAVCNALQLWFKSVTLNQGWPEEKLTIKLYPQQHFSQASKFIDQLMLESHRQSQPIFNMVIYCASFIDASLIDSWPNQLTQLFGKKYHASSIPSEGAAGVLIADNTTAMLFDTSLLSTIHKPGLLEIDANAQQSGYKRTQLLSELITHVLETTQTTVEQIKFVSSDTDSQTAKVSEVLSIGAELFPELDANEHYFSANHQCGVLGTGASLFSLALAHEAVLQAQDGAALLISHMDENKRAATVISTYKNIATNDNNLT